MLAQAALEHVQLSSRASHRGRHHPPSFTCVVCRVRNLRCYLTRLDFVLPLAAAAGRRRSPPPEMASATSSKPPPLNIDVLIQVDSLGENAPLSHLLISHRACPPANAVGNVDAGAIRCSPSAGKRSRSLAIVDAPSLPRPTDNVPKPTKTACSTTTVGKSFFQEGTVARAVIALSD
jgi:hypothetical protein